MADIILVKLETARREIEGRKYAPPFGLLYVAGALENAGYEPMIIHEEGNEETIARLSEVILKNKPLWVGFSTMTGPTIYPNLKASRLLKKRFGIPIVWGGIHPSILPEQTVADGAIDFAVIGEGEETSIELSKLIEQNKLDYNRLSGIAGICFKKNGKIAVNKHRPFIKNLDMYLPSWHLLDMENYIYSGEYFLFSGGGGNRIMSFVTSRGCPWRCGYCYNQAVNKRVFRAHTTDYVLKQIEYFKNKYNLTGIRFWDDNIFSDRERALKIVKKMELPWISSIRANELFDGGEGLIEELRLSGCKELNMGIESGSQKILKMIDKDITLEQVIWSANICSKYKISLCPNFMVGFPGETWRDICRTLDFIKELRDSNNYVGIRGLAIFTPLPGTPLYQKAIESGFKPPDSLIGWSSYEMGFLNKLPPYLDRRIKSVGYFFEIAHRKNLGKVRFPFAAKTLQKIARCRINNNFFYFPLDHIIPSGVRKLLERIKLEKMLKLFYKR